MPVIPNAHLPVADEGPSEEVKNPTKYRFEGFRFDGSQQRMLFRDPQGDFMIWRLRTVSQPLAFSLRAVSFHRGILR